MLCLHLFRRKKKRMMLQRIIGVQGLTCRCRAAAATVSLSTSSRALNSSSSNSNKLLDLLTTKDDPVQRAVLKNQPAPAFDHVTNQPLKFYDPPYLAREVPFPVYALLNINLTSYDYVRLDRYMDYVESLCGQMGVQVVEAYAMPARSYTIKTYKPLSSKQEREYALKRYHRIVRVSQVKSTRAPLLFEAVQLNLPEGVQMSVCVPTVDEDEFRYVPDIELNELKEELAALSRRPSEADAAVKK